MNRKFVYIIAAGVLAGLVGLTACGKSDDGDAGKAGSEGVQPSPGVSGAVEAPPENAQQQPSMVETLKEKSGIMTPEERTAAIARARANAEAAAKAVGQSDDDVRKAGEAAENTALGAFEAR